MHLPYFFLLLLLSTAFATASAQALYFPPATGEWEQLPPDSLGWCSEKLDSLHTFLDERNTKAFIVLKNGRMVVEWYFDDFTASDPWYWASAGKTMTATLVGIAQQEGFLDINDPTADYLGQGWTSCEPEDEALITIRHQLTMTTGLDDGVDNVDCTEPACLSRLAEPGTRWAYHNAPYTLLQEVIASATGMTTNQFYNAYVGDKIGAGGAFLSLDYNRVFFSPARDMARFGLLILAQGSWDGEPVLSDGDYYQAMINQSQELNPSYGYLWWLNGQGSHMLPGLQFVFPQDLIPTAPDDLFAGLGKNDQKVYVTPSEGLVVIRLGDAAAPVAPALSGFDAQLWEQMADLACTTTHVYEPSAPGLRVFPNPASEEAWYLRAEKPIRDWRLYHPGGRLVTTGNQALVPAAGLPPGLYFLQVNWPNGGRRQVKLIRQ